MQATTTTPEQAIRRVQALLAALVNAGHRWECPVCGQPDGLDGHADDCWLGALRYSDPDDEAALIAEWLLPETAAHRVIRDLLLAWEASPTDDGEWPAMSAAIEAAAEFMGVSRG